MDMREKLIVVLTNLGRRACLQDIYDEYGKLYGGYIKSSIRCCLERNSSDTESYEGKYDTFYCVGKKGDGYWGLR